MNTGRPPKPAGQAINRNRPTYEVATLPAEGRRGPAPEPLFELDENPAAIWARLWRTPEATMWSEADVPALTRMVVLQANPDTYSDEKLLGRLLPLEDRFGLSPYARRQAKWQQGEPEAPAAKKTPPSVTRSRKLKIVDTKAG